MTYAAANGKRGVAAALLGGGQVEWLLQDGAVKAIIFRVSYQNNSATSTSALRI